MDRRQRKTREAIFKAFTELLYEKDFARITVGEIIERADVGRATFYSHFETKDFLLKELCGELFCHIFDTEGGNEAGHRHIFECVGEESVFLHLMRHLKRNDNNVLTLLSSQNNELFLKYFKSGLLTLVERNIALFEERRNEKLPLSFWKNHVVATFTETVRWWIDNQMKESPEEITEYFVLAV
ncbi:MAG: TetR/AcrR family transcriptional regulator [Clostridia bacterium]|nr:TetR/AcrR family transcriptional regulator [Clostridia bacterium]